MDQELDEQLQRYVILKRQKCVPEAFLQIEHNIGLLYFKQSDYKNALIYCSGIMCSDTLPESKFIIGEMYDKGLGIPKDSDMANKWFRNSCFQLFKNKNIILEKLPNTPHHK